MSRSLATPHTRRRLETVSPCTDGGLGGAALELGGEGSEGGENEHDGLGEAAPDGCESGGNSLGSGEDSRDALDGAALDGGGSEGDPLGGGEDEGDGERDALDGGDDGADGFDG